jgi:hypothetical protein
MVDVPVATPFTVPVVPIVATDVFVLLHTPPGVASLSDVVPPMHKLAEPLIAAGAGMVLSIMEPVMVAVVVQPDAVLRAVTVYVAGMLVDAAENVRLLPVPASVCTTVLPALRS